MISVFYTCSYKRKSTYTELCYMLFLTFSVLVATPKKIEKIKSLAAHPPPHAARSEKINQNHMTHLQALRRSRPVSRPYKDSFDSLTRFKECRFVKFYASV